MMFGEVLFAPVLAARMVCNKEPQDKDYIRCQLILSELFQAQEIIEDHLTHDGLAQLKLEQVAVKLYLMSGARNDA